MSQRQMSEVLKKIGALRRETEKKFDLLFGEFRTTHFPEENSNSPLRRRKITVNRLYAETELWKRLVEKISISMGNPISRIPSTDPVVIKIIRAKRRRVLLQRYLGTGKK